MSAGRKFNSETGRQYYFTDSQGRKVAYAVRPTPLKVVRQPTPVANYAVQAQQRRDTFGGILGAASGIAATAATTTAGASLAPVAVGLGLGYGAFKLGEALKIW